MARGLKFRIYEKEGFYYPCSENKGADQLRGYREADLRFCFRICKKPVFLLRGLNYMREVNTFLANCNCNFVMITWPFSHQKKTEALWMPLKCRIMFSDVILNIVSTSNGLKSQLPLNKTQVQ